MVWEDVLETVSVIENLKILSHDGKLGGSC
jgi:hypothetical protein